MTKPEFQDYRNRVLAKTNGADIHKVNGLLGLLLNTIALLEPSDQWTPPPDNVVRWEKSVQETTTDLAKLTGVHP